MVYPKDADSNPGRYVWTASAPLCSAQTIRRSIGICRGPRIPVVSVKRPRERGGRVATVSIKSEVSLSGLVAACYRSRHSPASILWPRDFTGSRSCSFRQITPARSLIAMAMCHRRACSENTPMNPGTGAGKSTVARESRVAPRNSSTTAAPSAKGVRNRRDQANHGARRPGGTPCTATTTGGDQPGGRARAVEWGSTSTAVESRGCERWQLEWWLGERNVGSGGGGPVAWTTARPLRLAGWDRDRGQSKPK